MLLLRQEDPKAHASGFDAYRRFVNAQALRLGILTTAAVQIPFIVFEWLALPDDSVCPFLFLFLFLFPASAGSATRASAKIIRHTRKGRDTWGVAREARAFCLLLNMISLRSAIPRQPIPVGEASTAEISA